jgi:hypothetical protein
MKRRTIVGIAGLGVVAGVLGWRFAAARDRDAIIMVLRKRLAYLLLDQAGVEKFADDLAATHQVSSPRLHLLEAAEPLYMNVQFSGDGVISSGMRHAEERIVTLYLLSSDFFKNGADQTRMVRYLGRYDAFQACASPFARPLLPV